MIFGVEIEIKRTEKRTRFVKFQIHDFWVEIEGKQKKKFQNM